MSQEQEQSVNDMKYIVFKREAFYQMMGFLGLPPWDDGTGMVGTELDCAVISEQMLTEIEKHRLGDAVVIRRQDLFASPALATYASMIAIAARGTADQDVKARLIEVADYFQQQSEAAADEGWKLPD